MNILQLCDNYKETTNLSIILKHLHYNVVTKYKLDNISIVSYDAFIVTIDFFGNNYEKNKSFFEDLKKRKKPLIYIYHGNNVPEDFGMNFFSNKYKIKYQFSDCSVLDTPNWNYAPETASSVDEAYSMISSQCSGICNVRNTKQFYIMKKDNILIMHDFRIKYSVSNQPDASRMPNMIKFILQTNEEESNEIVDWLDKVNILDDKTLNSKLLQNKEQIDGLLNEQSLLKEKRNQNDFYKSILYSSGDKLVEVVEKILEEMLEISIDDKDLKKQDLYFKLNDKNILVEIKGVNHPFQRDNISQVKRHIKDYADEHEIYGADVEKLCKGVLIINPYSLHDLKDKISKEFYSKEVIADAEYEKICTLDTLTLLNYYSRWKNNSKSINLKELLLNSNYNEPDYQDIISL